MALRRLLINTESAAAAQHNNALKGNQFTSPHYLVSNVFPESSPSLSTAPQHNGWRLSLVDKTEEDRKQQSRYAQCHTA